MSLSPTSDESERLQTCGLTPAKLITSKVLTTVHYTISIVQYQPTDRPIEDRYSITEDAKQKRLVVGVYDGHGGSSTSSYISSTLPDLLLRSTASPDNHISAFEALDAKMLDAFTKDHSSIFRSKSKEWKQNAEIVKSGSTALVLDISLEDRKAVVSNAGDCRLVLCRQPASQPATGEGESGEISNGGAGTVVWATADLNAKTPSEQDRLSSEHPNEDMIIVGGRLFGKLMSTRGFGDAHFKFPKSNHKKYINVFSSIEHPSKVPLNQQYESYFYGYKTPPYVTARPESSVVDLEGGDAVVLASDGLWDIISSEDVASSLYGEGKDRGNVALDVLCKAAEKKLPGDDVTIVVLQLLQPCVTPSPSL
ncbi:phophatase 2C family protein [Coprinopsis sp. MPI-PUGE-AT-0042]|nr:phophatase 2C family protein [Coprinopsis sp. MPI-PUGE-AT-0042]